MPSFRVNTKWAALSEVVPGLYLSGVSALVPAELTALRISCVINATEEVPNLGAGLSAEVERIKLWIKDTEDTDISELLDVVADRIQMAMSLGGRVLVHCVAGVSRSASLVLAYLLKYYPLARTLRDAFHLLAARRPLVRPNLGFWRQLIQLETRLRGRPSVRILSSLSADTGLPQLVPDVYLRQLVPNRSPPSSDASSASSSPIFRAESPEPLPAGVLDKENAPLVSSASFPDLSRDRHPSGQKLKFTPSLASLPEVEVL